MKEEIRTVERVEYLVSADGEYRRYVGGDDRESEHYKNAIQAVKEYEESARGALGQIVMSMKHKKIGVDNFYASHLISFTTECCDSSIYLFKVETAEQFEALVKWMKLQYPREEIHVAKDKPVFETIKVLENGVTVEKQQEYPTFYEDDEMPIDPRRYVGHTVVVYDAYDYAMYLEGTLEEVEERNRFIAKSFKDKVLKDFEK